MKWRRFTTKHKELAYAKKVAAEMFDRARFKEEMGIPLSTKRFGAVTEECLTKLEREIEQVAFPQFSRQILLSKSEWEKFKKPNTQLNSNKRQFAKLSTGATLSSM
jgi:hypothetical protein